MKKHQCSLGLGSESMLPKGGSKLLHNFRKLLIVASGHPTSYRHFLSYPAILAERQRQILEGAINVIHPYSWFSIIWNTFMIVISSCHMATSTLRFCFILEKNLARPGVVPIDHVLFALHCVCLADVVMRANMGYIENPGSVERSVVLNRKRIILHYLRHWFAIDLVSSLPVAYVFLHLRLGPRYLLFAHLIATLRCLKLFRVLKDLGIYLKVRKYSYIWRRCLVHAYLFIISGHFCTCLMFFAAILNYYWFGKMPKGYCSFMTSSDGDLTKFSINERYKKGMQVAFTFIFGTGYSAFITYNSMEIMVCAIVILYSAMFLIYTCVFVLKIYTIKFNSTTRFYELMNEVEKYMRHKQFPNPLKKRVRAFYNYRYQGRYFKEEAALQCLSEQLRNEITLHTCHKLLNRVALFEGLPAGIVGTVLGCLKPEVFMPNDLLIRAGDIGDCMYFIAYGTVAVYSIKGAEVCHLEDGAHFGEVALLMKDSKRVATVVALEITQVYRLNGSDFRNFIMTYEELNQRIEALASKRMHETILIDDMYKRATRRTLSSTPSVVTH